MTFFVASGNRDYAALVTATVQKGLLRTLAKPNLITLSGKEAKFLSGGEFPYPVSQGVGGGTTITIEFKPLASSSSSRRWSGKTRPFHSG